MVFLVLWKTMENWLRYCCKDLVRTHKDAREGSVADPGFPRRGRERQTLSLGKKPIIWPDFCRKLLENEIIGLRGSACPWCPPGLDPPMDSFSCFKIGASEFGQNIGWVPPKGSRLLVPPPPVVETNSAIQCWGTVDTRRFICYGEERGNSTLEWKVLNWKKSYKEHLKLKFSWIYVNINRLWVCVFWTWCLWTYVCRSVGRYASMIRTFHSVFVPRSFLYAVYHEHAGCLSQPLKRFT